MESLDYKPNVETQDIDIEKLRPNRSYDYLIQNRNASVADILSDKRKLQDFLKERKCPSCGEVESDLLFVKDSLNIVRCSSCTVVFVNPAFDEEKYNDLYRSEEYQQIVRKLGEDSHEYRKTRFGRERMDVIEEFHDPSLPKTILDIGCSTGFVIEEATDRGWSGAGIELNPSAAAFARDRGLHVHELPLDDVDFDSPFSVVTLYDVLEHLLEPVDVLRRVHDLLEPGGAVFVYVPNFESASRELLGEQNAHFIWPTHHLTYFTPLTLRGCLENSGFEVFHWETQGLDLVDWMWFLKEKTDKDTALIEEFGETLQFYINASGHGKNLRMYARKVL